MHFSIWSGKEGQRDLLLKVDNPVYRLHLSEKTLQEAMVEDDTEKHPKSPAVAGADVSEDQDGYKIQRWLSRISSYGIELRGVTPVPLEERTDTSFINVFFVWFTMSTNLLP